MGSLAQIEIRALSILIPAVAAVIRYRAAPPAYRSFLLLLWIGALNEIISITFSHLYHTNLVNSNMYVFIEYGFVLYFFACFNEGARTSPFAFLLFLGILVWLADNLWLHTPATLNSGFRVFYSVVVVVLSIRQIHRLVGSGKKRLMRNPLMLFCIGFILFYGCKAIVESFYVLRLEFSEYFYNNMWRSFSWVNVFINLLYTMAILLLPARFVRLYMHEDN